MELRYPVSCTFYEEGFSEIFSSFGFHYAESIPDCITTVFKKEEQFNVGTPLRSIEITFPKVLYDV